MIHPDQCNECGRFAFESCGKPRGRCPRREVAKPITGLSARASVQKEAALSYQGMETHGPAPTPADGALRSRMMGYTGDVCPMCSNFTMVRNGTCLKCDTCGSTTGCS